MDQAAHDFVDAFVDFWREPSPERLPEILHSDVVLLQPLAPPLVGIDAAQAEFAATWAWIPDLRARVERWHGDAASVFIELRLSATWGARSLEWSCVDRLLLRGGRATQRSAFFDSLPLLLEMPRHPSVWASWWRSGNARPWRSGHRPTVTPARERAVNAR